MRYLRTLTCVLISVIALASCASSRTAVSELSKPQPEVSAGPCSANLPEPSNDPNQCPVVLKKMYDLYGECAGLKFEQYRHGAGDTGGHDE